MSSWSKLATEKRSTDDCRRFYDSIEITRDRAIAKFHRRATRRNVFVAFVLTLAEAIAALLLLRWGYRAAKTSVLWATRRMGKE